MLRAMRSSRPATRVVLLGATALLAGVLACTSDPAPASRAQTCAPGASVSCVGPGGCAGGQVCNADGTGFDACDCALAPRDGGSTTPAGDSGGQDASDADSGCTPPATPPRVIFLNRGGGTYAPAATADSRMNKTPLVSATETASPWSIADGSFATLRACVAQKLEPFNVTITDVDPGASVEHFEIVFAQATLPALASTPSVAQLTCKAVPNAIAFVSQTYAEADLTKGCAVAVSALGYSLGLEAVVACPDAMTFDPSGCPSAGFSSVAMQCGTTAATTCQCGTGGATTQSSFARMLAELGPRCLF